MQKAAHSMGLQAERTLQVGRENSDKNGNSDRNMYCVIHTSQSANAPWVYIVKCNNSIAME